MESMDDYKEELEASLKKIRVGDVVTGTVIDVTDDAVIVDLKAYADGVIRKDDLSEDPDFNMAEMIHPGDEITATVMATNDGEGNMVLSKKEANQVLAWDKLKNMMEERTVVPVKIAEIVKGVAEGCVQSEAALIGGETAEHPGLMPEDEYDLAGFAVGVCDKKEMITGEELKAGDVLIGMASTGVHSNGFSLVRKVFDMTKESLDTYYEELGTTLGEALLAPTRIYVKALKSIKNAGVRVHACSHITGGGFYENIPRMLKEGTRAVVEKNSYPVLPIFKLLAEKGNIDEQMMYNTYNMGLGMILAVDAADVDKTMEAIKAAGDTPYVVGRIEDGEKGVTLC